MSLSFFSNLVFLQSKYTSAPCYTLYMNATTGTSSETHSLLIDVSGVYLIFQTQQLYTNRLELGVRAFWLKSGGLESALPDAWLS